MAEAQDTWYSQCHLLFAESGSWQRFVDTPHYTLLRFDDEGCRLIGVGYPGSPTPPESIDTPGVIKHFDHEITSTTQIKAPADQKGVTTLSFIFSAPQTAAYAIQFSVDAKEQALRLHAELTSAVDRASHPTPSPAPASVPTQHVDELKESVATPDMPREVQMADGTRLTLEKVALPASVLHDMREEIHEVRGELRALKSDVYARLDQLQESLVSAVREIVAEVKK